MAREDRATKSIALKLAVQLCLDEQSKAGREEKTIDMCASLR